MTEVPAAYVRPVVRIAVRCRKANGQFAVGVLISALSAEAVLALTKQPSSSLSDPAAVLLAYVRFYDQRGGGVETSLKGDKQGLGLTKRNKKRFEAQQILVLLGSLAHNVVVWAREFLNQPLQERVWHEPVNQGLGDTELAIWNKASSQADSLESESQKTLQESSNQASTKLQGYGMLRMVRDVFHVSGFLLFDPLGHVFAIILNKDAPLAYVLVNSLRVLLAPQHIAVQLGPT